MHKKQTRKEQRQLNTQMCRAWRALLMLTIGVSHSWGFLLSTLFDKASGEAVMNSSLLGHPHRDESKAGGSNFFQEAFLNYLECGEFERGDITRTINVLKTC